MYMSSCKEVLMEHIGTGQVGKQHTESYGQQQQRLELLDDSQIKQHQRDQNHDDESVMLHEAFEALGIGLVLRHTRIEARLVDELRQRGAYIEDLVEILVALLRIGACYGRGRSGSGECNRNQSYE